MDWIPVLTILAGILGTSGVAGVIMAWRKARPEADRIVVTTQEQIFGMATSMLENVQKRLVDVEENAEKRIKQAEARADRLVAQAEERAAIAVTKHEKKILNHEKRIQVLERRLRDAGLPWKNGEV